MCKTGRFLRIGLLGSALSLAAPLPATDTQQKAAPLSERVKIVRQMYEKVPPLIFGVVEPLAVSKATMYEDGGTIVVVLKDARGKMVVLILDRRIKSPTRESMFLADDNGGKKQVQLRGPEEAALYGVLLRWRAADDTEWWTRVSVEAMLGHLDQRFAGEKASK